MKQPTDQRERNEDKKKPEENPSRGIDPETEEPDMEAHEKASQERPQEKPKKDDPLVA